MTPDHYGECPRYFPRPTRRHRNTLAECPKCGQWWVCRLGYVTDSYEWQRSQVPMREAVDALGEAR